MKKNRAKRKALKVVVLTNKESHYGRMILNELLRLDKKADAVIVIKQPIHYYFKLFIGVYKRVGFDAFLFSVKRLFKDLFKKRPVGWKGTFIYPFEKLSKKIIFTNGTNTPQTIDIIRKLEPDLLIVGQTGILKEKILSLSKIGILNGHPGLLPYYRGIDCAKWAIYNEEFNKIGSSVHWIDTGVDTGRIIETKRYHLKKDEKADILEEKLFVICSNMLAKIIRSLRNGKSFSGKPQNLSLGKQYYKMRRKQEREAEKKLSRFIGV